MFQSTPLVFQRRNHALRAEPLIEHCFNPLRWSSSGETAPPSPSGWQILVSIHSAGLPAEKPLRADRRFVGHRVSIHSAGLPAEKHCNGGGVVWAHPVSIHSAGLPAEKLPGRLRVWRARDVSIHSAGLPAEKRVQNARKATCFLRFNPLRWSSSGETNHTLARRGAYRVSIH